MARSPRKAAASRGAQAKAPARTAPRSAPKPAPKRPPEVSAKDWRGYSESYRKRLAGFYRKNPGAPRYEARGKKAGESLTRREKLEARIAAWAQRQSYRGQGTVARSPSEIAASVRALIADKGEGAFGKLERRINALHARWTQHGRPRKGERASLGVSIADEFDDIDWGEYDGEESELFYH